jgi:hypothetical protein
VKPPKYLTNYVVGGIYSIPSSDENMANRDAEMARFHGLVCEVCGKVFRNRHRLKYHYKRCAGNEEHAAYAKQLLAKWPKPGRRWTQPKRTVGLLPGKRFSGTPLPPKESKMTKRSGTETGSSGPRRQVEHRPRNGDLCVCTITAVSSSELSSPVDPIKGRRGDVRQKSYVKDPYRESYSFECRTLDVPRREVGKESVPGLSRSFHYRARMLVHHYSLADTPPFCVPSEMSGPTPQHTAFQDGLCPHVEVGTLNVPLPPKSAPEFEESVRDALESNLAEEELVNVPTPSSSTLIIPDTPEDFGPTSGRRPSDRVYVTPGMRRRAKPLPEEYHEVTPN